jgi:hypothetical protein
MDLHDSRSAHPPEASTDELASPCHPAAKAEEAGYSPSGHDDFGQPVFASPEAEKLYWRAYMDGARSAGREPGHPHMPVDFSLDLSRGPDSPSLVSSRLIETWPEAVPVPALGDVEPPEMLLPGTVETAPPAKPSPDRPRAVRHDGWTPERQRIFLDTLARTGVVADACRAARMSRDGAYEFRRRAAGAAFAIAWDAALLISRGAIADDVMSRARHGVIDRVYRDGELVAERHRYDNRLTMAVLSRLDRLAEGLGENAPVARAVAQEWDQFLDVVETGDGEEAARFLRNRAGPAGQDGAARASPDGEGADPLAGRAELLGRLACYEAHGAGLPAELATADLDPARMESWTGEQWARAEASGFLDRLAPEAWPAAAREEGDDRTDGSCKLRQLYLLRHPPAASPEPAPEAEDQDDFEGGDVWEEPTLGWVTNFPPPDGFTGYEEGDPCDDDYVRELTAEELEACDSDPETLEAERQEDLEARRAARDRFFGFTPAPPRLDPPSAPDQS